MCQAHRVRNSSSADPDGEFVGSRELGTRPFGREVTRTRAAGARITNEFVDFDYESIEKSLA